MSLSPTAMPLRPPPGSRPLGHRRLPWGWVELVGMSQYLLPTLLFLPFVVGPVRTGTRILNFVLPLMAWAAVVLMASRQRTPAPPARPWLIGAAVWLTLSIFNPLGNSLLAAAAEAALAIAIFSPVFWVNRFEVTVARMGRLIMLLFLLSAASTLVGIAQFYYPGRFDPPNMLIQSLKDAERFASYFYQLPDGRLVLRPCGLTDSPGGASASGAVTFLLGLGLFLRPKAKLIWRLPFLPLATSGLAILYFTQVRQTLIVAVGGAVLMAILFALRGDKRRALTIAGSGAMVFGLGLLWAMRSGGDVVLKRFVALFEQGDAAEVYMANRGRFVEYGLTRLLPDYPLGAGLGRWGMSNLYFGTSRAPGSAGSVIWCEEQITAWVLQGGVVMLTLYIGALVVTMWGLARIVRKTPDPNLAIWAAVTTAVCAATLASTFGYPAFTAPQGLTFWLLTSALFAADHQVRLDRRRQAARRQAIARSRVSVAAAMSHGSPAMPPFQVRPR